MMMPVQVQQVDGQYRATLLGAPGICGHSDTSAGAVEALRAELRDRYDDGRLNWVNIPTPWEDEFRRPPTPEEIAATEEMVAEIYRERAAQKAAEFPE